VLLHILFFIIFWFFVYNSYIHIDFCVPSYFLQTGRGGDSGEPAWPPQPAWFESAADYANLADGFAQAGFSAAEVERIMGRNWLDFFARAFGPAAT